MATLLSRPTFLDGVVPLDGPRLELLRVQLLDLGALHDERREVRAESVAVLDAPRRPLVVAGLPERVRAGEVHLGEGGRRMLVE